MTDSEPCLGIFRNRLTLDSLAFPKEGDAWWISEGSESHASSALVFTDGAWVQAAPGLFRKPTKQECHEGSKKRQDHVNSVIASRIAQSITEVEDERILKEIEAKIATINQRKSLDECE